VWVGSRWRAKLVAMSEGRRLQLAWVTGLFVLFLLLFELRAFAVPVAFAAGALIWILTGRRVKRQQGHHDDDRPGVAG